MLYVRKIIIGALFLCCNSAIASVYSNWQKVDEVRTGWDNEKVLIKVENSIPDPYNCGSTTVGAVPATALNNDKILSIALTALASGKTMRLVISNSSCEDTNPKIRGIQIRD